METIKNKYMASKLAVFTNLPADIQDIVIEFLTWQEETIILDLVPCLKAISKSRFARMARHEATDLTHY